MAEIIEETSINSEIDIELFKPGKFKVVVLNDDSTPMDFVIAMLMHVFHHSEEKAKQITLQIHQEGSGIAGIYTHEIAEQKGTEGTLLARQHGWPLALKIEEE
jgi:ATP-dependent Clp protease adaptor protein ClpS